ncbi:DUF2269 family protein [Cohnella yongneupensis]|uniref:DUF2269 family protein n=1 Tax=Cohnella yongneupensis TaxID=425006 RepID=A0ABW0R0Y2_9BACL
MGNISLTPRRWLLTLHLLFSGILLGVSVAFLILSLFAVNTNDEGVFQACYHAMHLLSKTSVIASTIGALVTGVLLSVLTRWGLFKFYWIIVKEVLTLVSIGLGPIGMYFWTLKAADLSSEQGLNALQDPGFIVNHRQMAVGIILQILSLVAMFILSVFKPWGERRVKKG